MNAFVASSGKCLKLKWQPHACPRNSTRENQESGGFCYKGIKRGAKHGELF